MVGAPTPEESVLCVGGPVALLFLPSTATWTSEGSTSTVLLVVSTQMSDSPTNEFRVSVVVGFLIPTLSSISFVSPNGTSTVTPVTLICGGLTTVVAFLSVCALPLIDALSTVSAVPPDEKLTLTLIKLSDGGNVSPVLVPPPDKTLYCLHLHLVEEDQHHAAVNCVVNFCHQRAVSLFCYFYKRSFL